MTLNIELDPQTEALLLAAAKRVGMSESELALRLVQVGLSMHDGVERAKIRADNQSTIDLFAKWREEGANMTPEQMEKENRFWEEFRESINEYRREQGMRQL
jgi:hypothetical protein